MKHVSSGFLLQYVPPENPRPQAQGRRNALAARSACSAVDCVPLRYANTCREPTECAIGLHKRSNGTFAASFRSFLSAKKRTRFSFAKGERYVLFSLRRKAPKDSPRRCLGLSFIYWKVYTHGSQQLFALASLGKPTFAVREVCATGKLASAGARLSERTRCPFGVFRRGLRTSVVRKHVPGADGIYSRIAPTVKPKACSSFDAFLSAKKSMRFLLSKGKRKSMLSHAFSFLFRHNVIRVRSPEIVRNKIRIRFLRNIEAASFGKPFPCAARHIVDRAFIRIHR